MAFQKNIEEVVLFQLDKTSKAAKLYSQREFDKLEMGVTVDQWVLLKILDETNAISQKELAMKSVRDPASITRTLDLLEKNALIQRTQSSADRRQYDIDLTPEGKRFVHKHLPLIHTMRQQSTKGISQQELTSLVDTLKKIQANFT